MLYTSDYIHYTTLNNTNVSVVTYMHIYMLKNMFSTKSHRVFICQLLYSFSNRYQVLLHTSLSFLQRSPIPKFQRYTWYTFKRKNCSTVIFGPQFHCFQDLVPLQPSQAVITSPQNTFHSFELSHIKLAIWYLHYIRVRKAFYYVSVHQFGHALLFCGSAAFNTLVWSATGHWRTVQIHIVLSFDR